MDITKLRTTQGRWDIDIDVKRHRINVHNGHVKARYVFATVKAVKGDTFYYFENVCPFHCLEVAKSIQKERFQVVTIDVYYTPVGGYNEYSECWWYNTAVKNKKGTSKHVYVDMGPCGCKK